MTKLLATLSIAALLSVATVVADDKICKHCTEICKKAMEKYKKESSQAERVKLMKLVNHCDAVREKENCPCKYQRSNK